MWKGIKFVRRASRVCWVQRMEAGVIQGWFESGRPPNSFGLFSGNRKGAVRENFGRRHRHRHRQTDTQTHTSHPLERSSEGEEGAAVRSSPQTPVFTPPRVFRSPGTEGGVGRGRVESDRERAGRRGG